jgi:hypothetical protein
MDNRWPTARPMGHPHSRTQLRRRPT